MKKVRITVNKGSKGKSFNIFNSPESLYVWLNDPELQEDKKLDPSLGNTIYLKKGEVMEVEWCGCEYVYEKEKVLFRADYIRIGKMINMPSFLDGKNIVGIQDGWVVDDIISFRTSADEAVKTTKLTTRSRHKFNLDELFLSKKNYDELEEDFMSSASDDQFVN
jgi:hypothetical protein